MQAMALSVNNGNLLTCLSHNPAPPTHFNTWWNNIHIIVMGVTRESGLP